MYFNRNKWLKISALGALLAVLFWLAKGPPIDDISRPQIVISEAEVAHQAARWERMWGRPPTAEELKQAVDAYVRNEILYREAIARDTDREDPRVRMALIQKMQMLAAGRADAQEVTERDLAAFFALRKEQYRIPAELSLLQVFFQDKSNAQDRAVKLLNQFRQREPAEASLGGAGDEPLLETSLHNATAQDIEKLFGSDFTAEVLSLPADEWSGPVRSGYGLHVVKVFDRVPSRIPELSEVQDRVENDLRYEAGKAAEEQGFQEIAGKYQIAITEGAENMLTGRAAQSDN